MKVISEIDPQDLVEKEVSILGIEPRSLKYKSGTLPIFQVRRVNSIVQMGRMHDIYSGDLSSSPGRERNFSTQF